MTFDPRTTGEVDEHGPVISPDGRQILLWTESGPQGQVMVAPSDGSARARALGPPFSYEAAFDYAFAPDGLTAILNIRFSKTWLINIAFGQGEQTDEPVLNFSSWQRLAQPLP